MGRERLAAALAAGAVGPLPEAPQHRRWREARAIAEQHIGQFAEALDRLLVEASALLGSESAASSERWIALGEQLKDVCVRYGSASTAFRSGGSRMTPSPTRIAHGTPDDVSSGGES